MTTSSESEVDCIFKVQVEYKNFYEDYPEWRVLHYSFWYTREAAENKLAELLAQDLSSLLPKHVNTVEFDSFISRIEIGVSYEM